MKITGFTLTCQHKPPLLLLCAGLLLLLNACRAIKPYERVYLNDRGMQQTVKPVQHFEKYFQEIREGALFPNGENGSGGCGCN